MDLRPLPDERRCQDRVPLGVRAALSIGSAWTETDARLLNIATGGMQVASDRVPGAGAPVKLTFLLEGHDVGYATGKVAWACRGVGFGVQFVRTSASLRIFTLRAATVSSARRAALAAELTDVDIRVG